MDQKNTSIAAFGIGGRWVVYWPGLLASSVLGFLFWSAVIAAVRQVLELLT